VSHPQGAGLETLLALSTSVRFLGHVEGPALNAVTFIENLVVLRTLFALIVVMKYHEILMEPWGFSSRQCGIPPSLTQLVMLYWMFTISQMSGNVSVKSIRFCISSFQDHF
jgi:hypothetical protein